MDYSVKTCIQLSEIQSFFYSNKSYYSCKIKRFYFNCPPAVTVKQTPWGLHLNPYHRQKWGYKHLKYSSFGSLFKSLYPVQYFRVDYIIVINHIISSEHPKGKYNLSLYFLVNENCSIILHIEEKLHKVVNCLPT